MKKEICNAYTELNDPIRQRELFEQQAMVCMPQILLFFSWPLSFYLKVQLSLNERVNHCMSLIRAGSLSGQSWRWWWSHVHRWDLLHGTGIRTATNCRLGDGHRSSHHVPHWLQQHQGKAVMWIIVCERSNLVSLPGPTVYIFWCVNDSELFKLVKLIISSRSDLCDHMAPSLSALSFWNL